MPQILIPYLALFGIPLFTTIRGARQAGFDGVEIHLAGQSQARALRCRSTAYRLGLRVHLHQGWSRDENPTHWYNHALSALGCLPPDGYRLIDHIPLGVLDPVVVYAERLWEASGRPFYWIQTCCQPGAPKISFQLFLAAVERGQLPVVFDVQHYLEFRLGLEGVGDLPTDRRALMDLLGAGWKHLGPLTKEIHLDDADPRLGHTRGRNVPLGSGVLPLRDFCRMVKASGWDGTVVPEVSPFHLRGQRRRYAGLRRQVAELLS